jgi:hypothetical protein
VEDGQRLAEPLRIGADACGRESLRREQLARERRNRLGVDRVDLGADTVERQDSVSVSTDFPSRLARFEVDSIESMIRPFRFSLARASSAASKPPSAITWNWSAMMRMHSARLSSRVPR